MTGSVRIVPEMIDRMSLVPSCCGRRHRRCRSSEMVMNHLRMDPHRVRAGQADASIMQVPIATYLLAHQCS